MDISPFMFFLFAGLAIASAISVILKKSPVSSAFSLVLVFFSFAGIYALLDAHLLAALQVFVYAGAIMVLFIFVIMLLNSDVPSFDLGRSHVALKWGAGALCTLAFMIFVWSFKNTVLSKGLGVFTVERIEASGGNTQVLSELMFSEYLLPFELTSVLLLAAMVGAVAITKRKPPTRRS